MKIEDFHFDLPASSIAQTPADQRESARLMILDRPTGRIHDARFSDLAEWLPPSALLVINDAKVAPARLFGRRKTGGLVEAVILEPPSPEAPAGVYELDCLVKPARRIKPGETIDFGEGVTAEAAGPGRVGPLTLAFNFDRPPAEALEAVGYMPLPPYIKRSAGNGGARREMDRRRYQTVYARRTGAVAAPTAGLHFAPGMLEGLQQRGFQVAALTLLVGYGTFAPPRPENIAQKRLHEERIMVPGDAAEAVNRAKAEGRPVVAVGTTTVRALEHIAREYGRIREYDGTTDLFLYPGRQFKVVDHLVTNFHLPGSSLLMLTAAFAGREFVLEAYNRAVKAGYRFFSYGDATLIR